MKPVFFATAAQFSRWLRKNHATEKELWVGFHKVATGEPCMRWPDSVDEALCVGWIDGIRKRLDDASYAIRFTPRRATSVWSNVNIAKAKALIVSGRMQPAGLAAYRARKAHRTGIYSYEKPRRKAPA